MRSVRDINIFQLFWIRLDANNPERARGGGGDSAHLVGIS